MPVGNTEVTCRPKIAPTSGLRSAPCSTMSLAPPSSEQSLANSRAASYQPGASPGRTLAEPKTTTVLATPQALDIMGERYGRDFAHTPEPAAYGQTVARSGVDVTLVPAGHVLGSAQAVVRWKGLTMVVSGDYKRRRDPTCSPFEPVVVGVQIWKDCSHGWVLLSRPGWLCRIFASCISFK